MKKLTSLAVLLVYLVNLGCHSMRNIPVSEANSAMDTIFAVIYPSGEVVEFNEAGGVIDSYAKTIDGTKKSGGKVSIPIDETLYVRVKRSDPVKTVLAAVGIGTVAVLAFAAIFVAAGGADSWLNNCPYVYSFDGKDFNFDAQPLGGAISRGLERTDLSRLEHLRPIDGGYQLLIRNEELNETQYLDEAKLIVADHPADTRVVPDSTGTLHVISNVIVPDKVTDEAGRDIHRFFDAPDEIAWQTKMPVDDSWRELPRRQELTFEFRRPSGAISAYLVVKAGNAQWGSEMIHRIIALHGDAVDEWQASMDSSGIAMDQWNELNTREELYSLRLDVFADSRWATRAWIPGGASLVTEERVIPVDLTGVCGNVIKMRVCPPRGYWSLDFLGLAFQHSPPAAITIMPLQRALTGDGTDVASLLRAADGGRYVMPRTGDEVRLEFASPEKQAAGSRTVFLGLHGYYRAHIDKSQPEQRELLGQLARNRGQIVEYSMDLYMKWRTDLLSQR